MATRTLKAEKQQNRGNNPITLRGVRSFLTANPGSTIDEIMKGTGLARNTVSFAVDRIAEPTPGSWPRRWVLDSSVEIEVRAQPVPLKQTWARWIKATHNWPTAIGKLSRQEDPKLIAAGLEQLAVNAAALAASFRAVQDEPDWLERIGG